MKNKDIERSIITRFRKEIFRPFVKAVNEYQLIEENDIIAVCISGGKDSFLLAKCMEELKKHGKIPFEIKFILMNPGYNKENLDIIKENANKLEISLHIFDNNIFNEIKSTDNACYLCARKRRGALYAKAKELGCNKIALGHHFDDVIETILMSMIYNGEFKTMLPKLFSTNFEGMSLIRPLYYVKEKDIKSWQKYNNLNFIDCACIVTKKNTSKRLVMKELIKHLNQIYKGADLNILNSTKDVNLSTIISYVNKNEKK
ncbi:MAG: tRNA 2-thiocytidine biosynthesis protein TtcA [Bacilli bacterium]|nr:tRNA 2-thiocytidine biosynthesis protein TtcA [Bacilli bacterium]